MVGQVNEHLGIPTKQIVEWTQAFVRHPSPQTERFEHEPQVQSFIGERVVPLCKSLACPGGATRWVISWSSLGRSRPIEA